jgi:uncharacterized membrane protein
MPTSEINVVLAWLHILFAIGWMGSALFFTIVVGPLLPKLSPPARTEVAIKLIPKFSRTVSIFASLAALFGIALAFGHVGSNLSVFSPNNFWGLAISLGASLTFVAFILAMGVVAPASKKFVKLLEEFQRNPQGGPPAEIPKLQKRISTAGLLILILLFVILALMVAASRPA